MNQFMDHYFGSMREELPPGLSSVLAPIMKDINYKRSGNDVPDPIGAEYFFLREFITVDMECDFSFIENDFLKHCRGKLDTFTEYTRNIDLNARTNESLGLSIKRKLLYLIYGGIQSGDRYCRELIKYLFKTYHRNLYRTLKKFRVISLDEIFAIQLEEDEISNLGTVAIILIMCPFMEISFSEEVSVLFFYLKSKMEEYERDNLFDDTEPESGLFEQCMETVDAWLADDKQNANRRYAKKYFEEERFVSECMNYCNYPTEFPFATADNYMGLRIEMCRTLMLLKMNHPKREYTYEQVQQYTMIYTLCSTVADMADCFDIETDQLLSKFDLPDEEEYECLFDASKIEIRGDQKKTEPKTVISQKFSMPEREEKQDTDKYLQEISLLRSRLDDRDREIKRLRESYRTLDAAKREIEEMVHKYESEREELIALREYAYQTQQEEPEISSISLEEMKKAISGKKIAIIGGHVNWHNKLKQQFPEWRFVLSEAFKTVDGKMLEGSEKVYFYTDHMSHVIYGKFISAVRERKIPFGYLKSIHLESVIRQVYEDLWEAEK